MPIYEYQCQECGYQLDKLQKASDAPLTDCPECNTANLARLVSAAGFRLKGSGWYETDFKTSKDKQKNLASGSDTKPSSEKESTNSSNKTTKNRNPSNNTTSIKKSST